MRLTIFSIPEPFTPAIRKSRLNAINSWRRIRPECEIILFGGDHDVGRFAQDVGIIHVPEVARSPWGTPLLHEVFARAQQMATGDVLMFSNCDMIYLDDLPAAIGNVSFPSFMLCGHRWDLEVDAEIPYSDDRAWKELADRHGRVGRMHGPSGLDFFAFPRSMPLQLPPFVVGRPGWDSWLLWYMRERRIPVVDGTAGIRALHQNHDYGHLKLGAKQYTGPEMDINYRMAGGLRNMLTLREADWVLLDGRVRRRPWPGRILGWLGPTLTYRTALALKRNLQRQLKTFRTRFEARKQAVDQG